MRDCEVFVNEILKKYKNRVYTMANASLCSEIVDELKRRGYAPLCVRTTGFQYIILTKVAQKQLVKMIKRRQEDLENQLEELEKLQKEIEEQIAERYRNASTI